MQALFKIQADEMNDQLLSQIKILFEGKPVTILIYTDTDETGYLNAYPANKEHLMKSMVSEPEITFTPNEFEEHVRKIMKQK